MKEYIDKHIIANEIRQKRQIFKGCFVLVEGHGDKKFYNKFFDEKKSKIIVSITKINVIGAREILQENGFLDFICIIDLDYQFLNGSKLQYDNMFYTDEHDIEAMSIKSPALEKIISEYGSEPKIVKFIEKFGTNIRTTLINAGKPIGLLRWISLREGNKLTFEGITFSKFINKGEMNINIDNFIKEVKNASQQPDLSVVSLKILIGELANNDYDSWKICCGHDLVNILSIGFKKAWGSHRDIDVDPNNIEKDLRLAYEFRYFCKTKLFKFIMEWEKNNLPYEIINKKIDGYFFLRKREISELQG